MAENTLSLNKTVALFGLAALAMIAAALFATMPSAGQLEAPRTLRRAPCHTEQVALDQGYGVSRMVRAPRLRGRLSFIQISFGSKPSAR